jgi:hypothetical protein
MLSEFYISVEDFDVALKDCVNRLSKWEHVNHVQRIRFADLARDMISFSEFMATAHLNATMWSLDSQYEHLKSRVEPPTNHDDFMAYISGSRDLDSESIKDIERYISEAQEMVTRMQKRSESRAGQMSEKSTSDLKACYKAYFFFIRAFHDGCYGVLLNLIGQTPGAYSSMNKCVTKASSDAYNHICKIPGYVDWFKNFKAKRDAVKMGQNFSLYCSNGNIGIGFNTVSQEGGIVVNVGQNDNKFGMNDLVAAFHFSIKVVELITTLVPHSNKALQSDAAEPRH